MNIAQHVIQSGWGVFSPFIGNIATASETQNLRKYSKTHCVYCNYKLITRLQHEASIVTPPIGHTYELLLGSVLVPCMLVMAVLQID